MMMIWDNLCRLLIHVVSCSLFLCCCSCVFTTNKMKINEYLLDLFHFASFIELDIGQQCVIISYHIISYIIYQKVKITAT